MTPHFGEGGGDRAIVPDEKNERLLSFATIRLTRDPQSRLG